MPSKPPKVVKIRLGSLYSLDIVRQESERIYLIVFSERGVVQRRTLIRLPYDDAMRAAKFLAGVDEVADMKVVISDDVSGEDLTDPGPDQSGH